MNHLRTLKILAERKGGDLTSLVSGEVKDKRASIPVPCPNSPNLSTKKSSIPATKPLSKRWSVNTKSTSFNNTSNTDSPSVSSLHDDISTKEEFKYSPELEDGAKKWIRQLLGDETLFTKESLQSTLKSGVILCRLINTIVPGTISKINTSSFNYSQMENIGNYLKACIALGLPKTDLFDTPDLWDKKNMNLVINNIHLLAKHVETKVEGYSGPKIDDTSQVRTLYSSALSEKQLSSIMSTEDEIREMGDDEKEMVDWMNSQLKKRDADLCVPHLMSHRIRTGVALIQLLEIITKMDTIGFYESSPQILWHCMQNASLILRFIYQQTFVELDCKSQEIVLCRIDALVKLLRFLRDKFDVDYLFLTVLNEGEENILTLDAVEKENVVVVQEDKETQDAIKDMAKIEAEIAALQAELDGKKSHHHHRRKAATMKRKGTKVLESLNDSPSHSPRKSSKKASVKTVFGDAVQTMANASDALQRGETVAKEDLARPGSLDHVKRVKKEPKPSAFDKILLGINADSVKTDKKSPISPKQIEQTKSDEENIETQPESKPETTTTQTREIEEFKQEEKTELQPQTKEIEPEPEPEIKPKEETTPPPKFSAGVPSKANRAEKPKLGLQRNTPVVDEKENKAGWQVAGANVEKDQCTEFLRQSDQKKEDEDSSDSSEESESSSEESETESSEYSSSESGEYTDSDEESSDDEETVKERQQRIEQLHKDQELAAKRAKELQSKKAQTKPPVAKNEQGKI